MDISEVLDRAKARIGTKSDAQLALRMGKNPTVVSGWRRGKNFPDDEHMILLCEIAELPPEAGLLALNMWRAGPRASAIYSGISNQLGLTPAAPTRSKATA